MSYQSSQFCWKLSQLKIFTIFGVYSPLPLPSLIVVMIQWPFVNKYIYIYIQREREIDSYNLLSQIKLTTCIYKGKQKKVHNVMTMFETTPFCILTTKVHFFLTTLFLKLQETITRNNEPSKLLFHKQNENGLIATNS